MKKIFIIIIVSTLLTSYTVILSKVKFGKIEGNVFENISREQMLYCKVFLIGTSNNTVTDMDGHFILDSITPGTYTLCAFELGYDTLKVGLVIKSGQKINRDLYINKSIQILSTDPLEDKIPK